MYRLSLGGGGTGLAPFEIRPWKLTTPKRNTHNNHSKTTQSDRTGLASQVHPAGWLVPHRGRRTEWWCFGHSAELTGLYPVYSSDSNLGIAEPDLVRL